MRALRASAVPYAVPVSAATRAFSDSGAVRDETVELQLRMLGADAVRVTERFAHDPTLHRPAQCDCAAERVARGADAGIAFNVRPSASTRALSCLSSACTCGRLWFSRDAGLLRGLSDVW